MFKLLLFGTLIVVPMTSIPDEKDYRMWNAGCAEHEKCYPNRKAQLANKNDSKKNALNKAPTVAARKHPNCSGPLLFWWQPD